MIAPNGVDGIKSIFKRYTNTNHDTFKSQIGLDNFNNVQGMDRKLINGSADTKQFCA